MPAKSLLKSVERLVPSVLSDKDITGDKSLALHLERYRFAAQQVAGGHVLDMACGVGYGSAEMAAIRKCGIRSSVNTSIART